MPDFGARWYRGHGGFIAMGRWSIAWLPHDDHVLLSERYGTTRTWRLGPLRIRRRGHLAGGRR